MAEYYDMGSNLLALVNTFDMKRKTNELKKSRRMGGKVFRTDPFGLQSPRGPLFVDPKTYNVRDTICVTGVSLAAIQKVKGWLADLVAEPLPIESFHVKCPNDVNDGALLVPKVVLAASHCPGRKLISSTTNRGDSGQLDYLYDEIHRIGADIIVLYVDLPRCVYPPNKTATCHPKAAELLFKDQPVLGDLAAKNCLFTVTEGTHLNRVQKKVIGDWVIEPVLSTHRIYSAAAADLDTIQRWYGNLGSSIGGYVTETEVYSRQRRMRNWSTRNRSSNFDLDLDRGFVSANDATHRQGFESRSIRSQLEVSNEDGDSDGSGWTSFRTRIKRKKKTTSSSSTYGSVSGLRVGLRQAGQRSDNAEMRPLLERDNMYPSYDSQELISVDWGTADDSRTNNFPRNGTSSHVSYM